MNVKVNDTVVVIAGGMDTTEKSIKGRTGTVLAVNQKNHTVLVKGVKMVKKHEKARKAQQVSKIVEVEAPIDVSNVMVLCPACNKPTRVYHAIVDGKKVRVHGGKNGCGATLDKAYAKASKKAAAEVKAEAPKKRTRKRTAKAEAPAEEGKKE